MAPEDALADGVGQRFARRTVVLAPGEERPYVEEPWRDALVVVERGELELVCTLGGSRRFGRGSILWLVDLPLRTMANRGDEPVELTAISRRRPIASSARPDPDPNPRLSLCENDEEEPRVRGRPGQTS